MKMVKAIFKRIFFKKIESIKCQPKLVLASLDCENQEGSFRKHLSAFAFGCAFVHSKYCMWDKVNKWDLNYVFHGILWNFPQLF